MLGSKHHVCESHTVLHMYTPESTPSALQQCAAPSYTLPRKPHNLIFIHISNYMYVFIYIYVCVSVCVSCPPSLKPTFLVPALESKPRRLFSISAPTPPTSVRSGYASFPCSLLLFQPTPTFRSFTLPSQVRETTGVVELQQLINPRVSNMASEDILSKNQLQMGDVPLPHLITRGVLQHETHSIYIIICMYVYIYTHSGKSILRSGISIHIHR